MTRELEAARAAEVVVRTSFRSITQIDFGQMFDVGVSIFTVNSEEATFARAVGIAFSAIGSGLSISTISGGSTHLTALINEEFVGHNLSYTVPSASVNVIGNISVTLESGAASAYEVVALGPFSSIIQVVSAQMYNIDVSMITVSSVEAMSASAILIALSATGSGLSMSTISRGSTQDRTVRRGVREPWYQLHRLFRKRHR